MTEEYIPLEQAAKFEGVGYEVIKKRAQRNPHTYKIQEIPNTHGGKPRKLVALSSLSPKARKAHKAAQKINEGDAMKNKSTKGALPWYVETDFHWYIENHKREYNSAIDLKNSVLEFLAYDKGGRTEHAEEFACKLGISSRSLYRYADAVQEGQAWADTMEGETGRSHDFYITMCLCRKPRQADTFPSLDPELRATIENIWFNERFRQNQGTKQMLYDRLDEKCRESGVELPSYKTVSRYVNHIVSKGHGASAEYLATFGQRSWNGNYLVKGERDLTQLEVMELVMSDEHTFDLFVSYTPANGVPIAVRPHLIGCIDVRSRNLISYTMGISSNMQDMKSTFAKGFREHGVCKHLLIDNGKPYTGKEMTGHDRKDRLLLDLEMQGFYRAIGIEQVFRSLPYQAWDKSVIERLFGTICNMFSKWFDSYVGTLTGSKTSGKVKKDIDKLHKQGKLFTMEEFYRLFDKWVNEVYHQRVHRGLKDSGEKLTKPAELFTNAERRYYKAAPPDSYISMLLMKPKSAAVKTTGIRHNKVLYKCNELTPYINQHVNIRFMPDDDSIIYAFAEDGGYIGEIPMAEKLSPHMYADREQTSSHKASQNRHKRDVRDTLNDYRIPFEEREEGTGVTPRLVGGIELTTGKQPANNAITLPVGDKEYRQSMKSSKKKPTEPNPFLDDLADETFAKLRKHA